MLVLARLSGPRLLGHDGRCYGSKPGRGLLPGHQVVLEGQVSTARYPLPCTVRERLVATYRPKEPRTVRAFATVTRCAVYLQRCEVPVGLRRFAVTTGGGFGLALSSLGPYVKVHMAPGVRTAHFD